VPEIGVEEVPVMESVAAWLEAPEWETPEFEEIGCAAEVTMYVARLED
jgi:coenzyme PQQ precursor peptide PqqA